MTKGEKLARKGEQNLLLITTRFGRVGWQEAHLFFDDADELMDNDSIRVFRKYSIRFVQVMGFLTVFDKAGAITESSGIEKGREGVDGCGVCIIFF